MADQLAVQLLQHALDRVRADLTLLESVGCIRAEDLEVIQARLPSSFVAQSAPAPAPAPVQVPGARAPPPPSARVPPPPPPTGSVTRAEAKWNYEADDPADLSFKVGDIIEVIEETSEDWWLGRLNGKEGLFPSNRCVKITTTPTVASSTPVTGARRFLPTHSSSNTFSEKTGINRLGLKAPTADPEKKDKYGKLKSTMANSAAGGVGFGAGAAIGGGLVRAIF